MARILSTKAHYDALFLRPLLHREYGGVGVLDCCASRLGKADLLPNHFDSEKSREAVDQPLTCHSSPSRTTFAFRSNEVRRRLLDYDGSDPLGMFPIFLKRTHDVMAPPPS